MNKPNNEIDPRLKTMLDELDSVPARDPKLASSGRARFLSQAVTIREEAVSVPFILRLRKWLDKFNKPKEFKMTTFVSIIAILGLLMGGSAGTVYASQDSLPNEMLYPVKIASEEIRMNFAGNAEAQLDLALEFAQNRSDEIDALLEEGEVIPEETMTRLQQNFAFALRVAGELEEGAKTKAVHRIRNMMQIQVQHLTNLEENAPEEATQPLIQTRTKMENQLRLIDEGGMAGEGLEQQNQEALQQNQGQEEGQSGAGAPPEENPAPEEAGNPEPPMPGPGSDTVSPPGPGN